MHDATIYRRMYLGKEVITDMTKDPEHETGDEKRRANEGEAGEELRLTRVYDSGDMSRQITEELPNILIHI